MAKGPLAARWGDWTLDEPRAGALGLARVEVENAGTVPWRDGILLAYHWLDDRDNPIVWDGDPHPAAAARRARRARDGRGARAGADPAGPLPLRARPRRRAPRVVLRARERRRLGGGRGAPARRRATHAELPPWVEPAADWHERVAAAHAEGYAVVARRDRVARRARPTAARARSSRTSPARAGPGLPASAALPVGARRRRARAAAGRRRPARVRRAGRRAVDLRRRIVLRRPDPTPSTALRARSRAGRRPG